MQILYKTSYWKLEKTNQTGGWGYRVEFKLLPCADEMSNVSKCITYIVQIAEVVTSPNRTEIELCVDGLSVTN